MALYCYVVIENEEDTTNTNIAACSDPTVDVDVLNEDEDTLSLLLRDGWRPVRETTMGSLKSSVAVLVLLERG